MPSPTTLLKNKSDGLVVTITESEIANPTNAILSDLSVTYQLNVAPYIRYRSDGVRLVQDSNLMAQPRSGPIPGATVRLALMQMTAGGTSTVAPTANTAYFMPFYVDRVTTITNLGCDVTVGAVGSIQLAIYDSTYPADTESDVVYPNRRLCLATADSNVTALQLVAVDTPIKLIPGKLYFSSYVANASATARFAANTTLVPFYGVQVNGGGGYSCIVKSATYPLPSTFTAPGTATPSAMCVYYS
jgi:hypothetical protein